MTFLLTLLAFYLGGGLVNHLVMRSFEYKDKLPISWKETVADIVFWPADIWGVYGG